jgi:hypothetical protein
MEDCCALVSRKTPPTYNLNPLARSLVGKMRDAVYSRAVDKRFLLPLTAYPCARMFKILFPRKLSSKKIANGCF